MTAARDTITARHVCSLGGKTGELLFMGDGSRWFHPYTGSAPYVVTPTADEDDLTGVADNHGMACPACGHDSDLSVSFVGSCTLTSGGSEDAGDHEWGDESDASCGCGFVAKVAAFRLPD
jgi:hypothetical protein